MAITFSALTGRLSMDVSAWTQGWNQAKSTMTGAVSQLSSSFRQVGTEASRAISHVGTAGRAIAGTFRELG